MARPLTQERATIVQSRVPRPAHASAHRGGSWLGVGSRVELGSGLGPGSGSGLGLGLGEVEGEGQGQREARGRGRGPGLRFTRRLEEAPGKRAAAAGCSSAYRLHLLSCARTHLVSEQQQHVGQEATGIVEQHHPRLGDIHRVLRNEEESVGWQNARLLTPPGSEIRLHSRTSSVYVEHVLHARSVVLTD